MYSALTVRRASFAASIVASLLATAGFSFRAMSMAVSSSLGSISTGGTGSIIASRSGA